MRTATAPAVLEVFREASARWGFPAALLTDNGCVYTTWHRGGPNVMQTELLALGIDYRHARPYHPQTCGKVERFHQTHKRLARQATAGANDRRAPGAGRPVRRLLQRDPPTPGRGSADTANGRFQERDRARPSGPSIRRWRRRAREAGPDRQEREGDVAAPNTPSSHRDRTRPQGATRHPSRRRSGRRGCSPVDGELLRHLTLDPNRDYQPQA